MNQITFKIILIGDSGSGKSCLLARFIKDCFADDYAVTVGVDFATKTIPIDQNYQVKLQIWDTAGQESFRSIVKTFYRNASAVFLIYDITRASSFQAINDLWLTQARHYTTSSTIYALVGTHLDMDEKRQVQKSQAQKYMESSNIDFFFETSSKTSENVAKAFEQIAKQLFMIFMKQGRRRSSQKNFKLQQPKIQDIPKDQNKCC